MLFRCTLRHYVAQGAVSQIPVICSSRNLPEREERISQTGEAHLLARMLISGENVPRGTWSFHIISQLLLLIIAGI